MAHEGHQSKAVVTGCLRPFQKGKSGNPAGKPRGCRSKATLLVEALLDGEAEQITRKAIALALGGDVVALRLVLERIVPPRRDRPVQFALPPLQTAADACKAVAAITSAIASGHLTPSEGSEFVAIVDSYVRAVEAAELEVRVRQLEEAMIKK
jgi:hypothetical protein